MTASADGTTGSTTGGSAVAAPRRTGARCGTLGLSQRHVRRARAGPSGHHRGDLGAVEAGAAGGRRADQRRRRAARRRSRRASSGDDEVDVFPAWETLPFERVSPSVETMGRRMRTMWHLRDPERAPKVVVAAGAGAGAAARSPRRGRRTDRGRARRRCSTRPTSWLASSRRGYRREYQVEHRGEVAVRGSIVDVFPSTADGPVRIDLWGDEVDRLTEFSVNDQRSDERRRPRSRSSRAASCCAPTTCASERCALDRQRAVGSRAVGATGRRRDLRRHGVVAAVARRPTSRCCSTSSGRRRR